MVCKAEIGKFLKTLTPDEQTKLDNLCNLAGSGNPAAIRAAAKQVCLAVLKDTAAKAGLAGPALTAAEASCNKAG